MKGVARTLVRGRTAAAAGVGLLIAASLLGAGPAAAKTKTLYSQLGNLTPHFEGINTQFYAQAQVAYDDQAADDFVVPDGKRWKVTRVDFDGGYTNGGGGNAGPTESFNVFFYKNGDSLPGKSAATQKSLAFRVKGKRTLVVDLKSAVHLGPGHYWVSVQANQDVATAGQFFWIWRTKTAKLPAAWENPGDAFASGCTAWSVASTCVDASFSALSFDLKGTSARHHGKPASASGRGGATPPLSTGPGRGAQAASPLSPLAVGTSSPSGASG